MAEDLVAAAWRTTEAFNKADWDAYRAAVTDDIVTEEVGTGRRTTGADAYVAQTAGWKTSFPDSYGTLDASHVSGDTVILELTWRGSQTGPLPLGEGKEFPPSGKSVEVPAVIIATIRDGKVASSRHFLDMMTLLTQIGAVPQ